MRKLKLSIYFMLIPMLFCEVASHGSQIVSYAATVSNSGVSVNDTGDLDALVPTLGDDKEDTDGWEWGEVVKETKPSKEDSSNKEDDSEKEHKPKPDGATDETEDEVNDVPSSIKRPSTSVSSSDLKDADLVTSDKIINSSGGSVRVTELYSINNQKADCYYRPKVSDVPLLANRVLKMGQYAAAYTGFFDLNYTQPNKPKGVQSRALEILGYDYLLMSETYDTGSDKYTPYILSDEAISEETAIMDLYKALGKELYDIKMVHKKANYTGGNSPAATLLNRGTITYSGGGKYPIVAHDNLSSYETYVFVTRTNPDLYMKKLETDFNIGMTTKKKDKITIADFLVMAHKMMQFYGEPEMSTNEMNQLVQVYGGDIPQGLESDVKDAWIYLRARGVLNINGLDVYKYLDKNTMYDILMRIKDKDSRINYKDIRVVLPLNQEIINQGYFPKTDTTVKVLDEVPMDTNLDYSSLAYYDYLVPINDKSRFLDKYGNSLTTMFVSNKPESDGNAASAMDNSSYVGIDDTLYYHFRIPVKPDNDQTYQSNYVRIDTPESSDKVRGVYLQLGGGIYAYDKTMSMNNGSVNFFKRRPFTVSEYKDYNDANRSNPALEFDWDSWKGDDGYKDVDVEESTDDTLNNIGLDTWEGASLMQVRSYQWVKTQEGKWRCYKYDDKEGTRDEFLQGGVYYLGGDIISDDPQKHMFAFDNDGWMIANDWYQEGHYWYWFDENGYMAYNTTLTIGVVEYDFDQYGRWIDLEYNVPDDFEDIWSGLDNQSGEWQRGQDGASWWFMSPDGTWLYDGVYKINDKLYAFDADGWMLTGKISNPNWDTGHTYYFDPDGGYMWQNATIPDGIWVGQNGRATGKWSLSWNNNPVTRMLAKAFGQIIAYAAEQSWKPADISTFTSGTTSKWYIHKIRKDMLDPSMSIEVIKESAKIGGSTADDAKVEVKQSGDVITVKTKRNAQSLMSKLTLSSTSQDHLVTGASAISNVSDGSKLLVPYVDMVNAGIVSDVEYDTKNNKLTLYTGSPYGNNETNTFKSNGKVVLDNNVKTIFVGTMVYRVNKDTTLFTEVEAEGKSYDYVATDGTTKTITDKMLMIDIRAFMGWSADSVSFYQDNSGEISVVAGSVFNNGTSNIKQDQVLVTPVNGKKSFARINTLTGLSREVIPLANCYSIANWSCFRNADISGKDLMYIIVSYYKGQFGSIQVPDDYEEVKKVTQIKTAKFDDYVYRKADLTTGGSQLPVASSTTTLEAGKFYYVQGYGPVYVPPTKEEWDKQKGYDRYLKGEWLLPLVCKDSNSNSKSITDMSVPYIEGYAYGTTTLSKSVNIANIHPQIGALSYIMFNDQVSSTKLDTLGLGNKNNLNPIVYFGQNAVYKSSGANTDYLIDGLIQGNDVLRVSDAEYKDKGVLLVNKYKSTKYSDGLGGATGGQNVYTVMVADNPTFEVTTDTGSDTTKPTYVGGVMQDIFNQFEKFSFDDFIQKIDEGTSFVILFAMQVLPITLFTLSMIVFLFALLGDWKFIRDLCARFFDPIEILTFGRRNIETANGIRFFFTVLLTTCIFALWANGNFMRILAWGFQAFGEYMNIIHNM